MPITSRLKILCAIALGCVVVLFSKTRFSEQQEIKEIDVTATKTPEIRSAVLKTRRKVVIILSNQRSGSSFTGGFFGENSNAFYLYEPLHPFGMSCTVGYREKLELVRKISVCDLKEIKQIYLEAFTISQVKTGHDCTRNHICSAHKHKSLMTRYSSFCESHSDASHDVKACELPLNVIMWSSFCRASDFVAMKILRVCSLEDLESIAKQLATGGSDLYVVELVRDPRGIINSALKLELRMANLNDRLDQLCGRFRRNSKYREQQEATKGDGIVSGGRYMRIRYEDIAEDPIGGAQNIYNFLGLHLPEEVKTWIEKVTGGALPVLTELREKLKSERLSDEEKSEIEMEIARTKIQRSNPYGTTRNSSSVLLKWRKTLKMDVVRTIQDKCGDIMAKFGYKLIETEDEKLDFTSKLW